PQQRSTLFPYTTLFRSRCGSAGPEEIQPVAVVVALTPGASPGNIGPHLCPEPIDSAAEWTVRAPRGVHAFAPRRVTPVPRRGAKDRKSTRLNSSHDQIS